jgi:hypothetical protein
LESKLPKWSASYLNSQLVRQPQPLRIEDNPRSWQIRTPPYKQQDLSSGICPSLINLQAGGFSPAGLTQLNPKSFW